MDVQEIRSAFSVSERLPERVREFRIDRAAKVSGGLTPIPLVRPGGVLMLHVLPASAFGTRRPDYTSSVAEHDSRLRPIHSSEWGGRHNFDGYVVMGHRNDDGAVHAYTQIFRNGAIEVLDTFLLSSDRGNGRIIPCIAVETELIETLGRAFELYEALGVDPPLLVMLSLLSMRGYDMARPLGWDSRWDRFLVDRDDLFFPETLVDRLDKRADAVLRASFDQLWQSAGWAGCPHYGQDGRWRDPGR